MNKVKIGVFGARRGRGMIDLIMEHPDAELVAICDAFEPALESCKRKATEMGLKIECFKDFDTFFECDMDAVVLANYATEHAPYAIRCLNAGRHVLSECLATQTMAEAVALVEAVEKSGKIYHFAENVNYFKTILDMKKHYSRGDIGEIQHCEGEYIHASESSDAFGKTRYNYGDPNHWRLNMYSTFYCSHVTGPLFYITGQRPVKVVGMENPPTEEGLKYGQRKGSSGIMFIELANGATMKFIQGNLEKEPSPHYFEIFGTKGCMETDRWKPDIMHIYTEHVVDGKKGYRSYECTYENQSELAKRITGHGGSDFYATDYFIRNILGDTEAAREATNIYQAIDMCIPGILGYRSILGGSIPVKVPDFRIKEEREAYRYDTACTDPKVAGAMLLPIHHTGNKPIDGTVYEEMRKIWEEAGKASPYFK